MSSMSGSDFTDCLQTLHSVQKFDQSSESYPRASYFAQGGRISTGPCVFMNELSNKLINLFSSISLNGVLTLISRLGVNTGTLTQYPLCGQTLVQTVPNALVQVVTRALVQVSPPTLGLTIPWDVVKIVSQTLVQIILQTWRCPSLKSPSPACW